MIQRIFCFGLFLFTLISCDRGRSNSFILHGFIDQYKDTEVVSLHYFLSDSNDVWREIIEVAEIIDSQFVFEGEIDELTFGYLCLDEGKYCIDIYLEPSRMKIEIEKEKPYLYKLSGTKVVKEIEALRKETDSYQKIQYEQLYEIYNWVDEMKLSDNPSVQDSLRNLLYNSVDERGPNINNLYQAYVKFVSKNKEYKISPAVLYSASRTNDTSIDSLMILYNELPEELKQSLTGRLTYRQLLEQMKNLNISRNISVDFIRTDFSGNKVQLADYIGEKYVLLDFWASWCGPCLKEIPNLKKIQANYEDQLAIIGISSDEDRLNWQTAVEKHELSEWSQVLALEDLEENDSLFKDDISDVYGVYELPTYILIDKEGKIIDIWENAGEENQKRLDEILLERLN